MQSVRASLSAYSGLLNWQMHKGYVYMWHDINSIYNCTYGFYGVMRLMTDA